LDHHAVGDRLRAGRDRLGRLLDLDEAHAAVAGDRQALVVAEARDLLAGELAGLQHRRSVRDLDLDPVHRELCHAATPPPSAWAARAAPCAPCTRRYAPPSPGGSGGSGPGSATPRRRPARRSYGPPPAASPDRACRSPPAPRGPAPCGSSPASSSRCPRGTACTGRNSRACRTATGARSRG